MKDISLKITSIEIKWYRNPGCLRVVNSNSYLFLIFVIKID